MIKMKYLFTLMFMAFLGLATSQTAFDVVSSRGHNEVTTAQASLANPWIGAKLSYNLNDENPVDDNFIFSARVLYIPVSGDNYAFPIVSNGSLGSTDFLSSESGFNFGVYPYYLLSNATNLTVILHGGVGYKVLPEAETAEDVPQQIRALAGLEFVYNRTNNSPITLSVTPVFISSNVEDNIGMLEVTGVLPIASGLGLLGEYQLPFGDNLFDSQFRFGVILNTEL